MLFFYDYSIIYGGYFYYYLLIISNSPFIKEDFFSSSSSSAYFRRTTQTKTCSRTSTTCDLGSRYERLRPTGYIRLPAAQSSSPPRASRPKIKPAG